MIRLKKLHAWMPLVLLLASVSASAQSATIDSVPPMLAIGDVARMVVWHRPELSGDFLVASDSSISHPLMRDLKLAGIPLATAEERLRVFLTRFDATPAFTFTPLQRVFIGGEVRAPNVYNVPPGTTLAQAIALAGGPTERGALEQIILIRGQQRHMLDLTLAASAADVGLRSGDQVLVTRRSSVFTDVVAPSGSILAALAAVVSIIIQLRR